MEQQAVMEQQEQQVPKRHRRPKVDLEGSNKEITDTWLNELDAASVICKLRRKKLNTQMAVFCKTLGKDIITATKQDIETAIGTINNRTDITQNTKIDYIRLLKQFFKWYRDRDNRLKPAVSDIDILECTQTDDKGLIMSKILQAKKSEIVQKDTLELYKFVETTLKRSDQLKDIDESMLLTQEDIDTVLNNGCTKILERAVISMLAETAGRIGEIRGIRFIDITHKELKADINITGKTDRRKLYIYTSYPYLKMLIEFHPYRNDPKAYLFCNAKRPYKMVSHSYMWNLVDRCFKKAKVNKPHNPHHFRHTRLTSITKNKSMSDPLIREFAGWTQDSRMFKTYLHFRNKDVEDCVDSMNGLKVEVQQTQHTILTCSICGTQNPDNMLFCHKCKRPLKTETLIQEEHLVNSEISKTIRCMMEMLKDPAQMAAFEAYKNNTEGRK